MNQQSLDWRGILNKWPKFLRNLNPNIYRSNNYVVLDFETTNQNKGSPYTDSNRIVLQVWQLGEDHPSRKQGSHTRVQWGNELASRELVEDIQQADFIVAHNTKFELGWLKRCGIELNKVLPYCTLLGDYVIAGNRGWELSLNACLKRRNLGVKLDFVGKPISAGVCPSEIPSYWLEKYGILDVELTHKLFLQQREELRTRDLLKTQFTRNIFTPVLVDLEYTGMHLDYKRVALVNDFLKKKLAKLEREWAELTGGISAASPKQKADFLYNTLKFPIPRDYKGDQIRGKPTKDWPDGQPTTKTELILTLKPRNKRQKRFIELAKEISKVSSSLNKNVTKMMQCVEEDPDGILRFTYNQALTGTHRLSSSGREYSMQGQNLPNEYKPLFAARFDGWEVSEVDEAQLEYRIAVQLGNDKAGLQSILDKKDRHAVTASIIFKEDWANEELAKEERSEVRRKSKPFTFKPLYGGKSGTPEQQAYYKHFCEEHSGITSKQSEWLGEAYRTKKLKTITGLTFHWPKAWMNNRGKMMHKAGDGIKPIDQAVSNYPVQSFSGAEVVPLGVVFLWHTMKVLAMKAFLVNTVHDSAVAENPPEEKELFNTIAVKSFTDMVKWGLKRIYNIELFVPLEAEVKSGTYWSDRPKFEEEYI